MGMPRVLFVNHTSTVSGAEMILLEVVKAWQGASAFLFEDGRLDEAMRSQGLRVIRARSGFGLSGLRRDGSLWRVVPLAGKLVATLGELVLAARRHDVIYANSQKAFVLSAIAATIARRPLIWHLHDIIDATHFGAAQRMLQVRLANACATRVVVPSEAARTAFVEAGGRSALVEVVPNGLDLRPDRLTATELRAELGLPSGPLVGVFSRLAPWKGQHVVLEALARLPGVRCIVVGSALFGEDDYAARLRSLVTELGLGDRVIFLGQRNDVPRLMQAVDAVIHPSIAPEPFGRTLVEAMLVGVPVIASDAGAAPEILDGGTLGTLVPPDDSAALAEAMARDLDTSQDLTGRSDRARAVARTRYGAAQMQSAVRDLIVQVAARRTRSGTLAVARS